MLVLYGGLAAQTLRLRRRLGRWPASAFTDGSPRDKAQATAALACPLLVLAWAYCPGCFRSVPRWEALETWPVRLLGLFCLCLATSVVWIAYAELGDSPRIGLDPAPGPATRSGIYASVRHPVHAGFSAGLLGIFLLAPNLMFAILWLAGTGALLRRARRKEHS